MTKSEFTTIWDEYFKKVRNAKNTCPDKAVQMYCAYLKEKGEGSLTCTDFLRKNGKNPEAPLFGYATASSAIYNAKYHMINLQLACRGEDFLDLVGDWKEEPTLFKEEQEAPAEEWEYTNEYMNGVLNALHIIAERLGVLQQLVEKAATR